MKLNRRRRGHAEMLVKADEAGGLELSQPCGALEECGVGKLARSNVGIVDGQ